jgi:hypothetical protein
MENITISEDIELMIRKIRSEQKLKFDLIKKESGLRSELKDIRRTKSILKSNIYFIERIRTMKSRELFQEKKKLMILMRKDGYSIRKIIMFIIDKEPCPAEYNYVSKMMFKDLKVKK